MDETPHGTPPPLILIGVLGPGIHEPTAPLSHSQRIYQNYSLHNTSTGYLRKKQRMDMLANIVRLIETDPEAVPPESPYLPLSIINR